MSFQSTAAVPIPDVQGILGPSKSQTALQVNKAINAGYESFALLIQAHLDPHFNVQRRVSSQPCNPNWFGFAPWASMQVGRGELSAHAIKHAITACGGDVDKYTETVCNLIKTKSGWSSTLQTTVCGGIRGLGVVAGAGSTVGGAVDQAGSTAWKYTPDFIKRNIPKTIKDNVPSAKSVLGDGGKMLQLAAAFWVHIGLGLTKSMNSGNLGAIFSWDVVSSMATRMETLLRDKAKKLGSNDPVGIITAILSSLESLLKAGNLAIFGDIGGGGQRFLQFIAKQANKAFAPEVILKAAKEIGGNMGGRGATTQDATLVYNEALKRLSQPTALFYQSAPFKQFANNAGSLNYMVAACALWQKAKLTTAMSTKNNLIAWGNNLLAWREQAIAVQPAFDMDRPLIHVMSPLIMLEDGTGVWTVQGYASKKGMKLSSIDWGSFAQRWPPIVNAFDDGYRHKSNIFKFKNPDVTKH